MKILLAFDGSASAATAVAAVTSMHLPKGSVVELLSAIPDRAAIIGGPWSSVVMLEPTDLAEQRREVSVRLEAMAAELASDDITVHTSIVEGRPATEIVHAADRCGAELIVVGARGQSAVERLLIGSVSSEVVDQAHCPVLVARSEHIGRVLVAVDGSATSDPAAPFAEQSRIFGGSSVRVVSVVDAGFPWWNGMSPVDGAVAAEAYEDALVAARIRAVAAAAAMRDQLAGEPGASGNITCDPIEQDGDIGSTIVGEAARWHADVIVLGTRGFGLLHRALVGSTSRHVLHQAPVSVLIARRPGAPAASGRTRAA